MTIQAGFTVPGPDPSVKVGETTLKDLKAISEATQTLRSQMTFGYPRGIPDGVTAAIGLRAILDGRTGSLDILWDRISRVGPEKEVDRITKAFDKALPLIRKRVAAGAKNWTILGSQDEEHLLVDTKALVVIANTCKSHGYLYIAAYVPTRCQREPEQLPQREPQRLP